MNNPQKGYIFPLRDKLKPAIFLSVVFLFSAIGVINAVSPVLQSIEITNSADKLTYFVREDLDITGLKVTGMYLDENEDVNFVPVAITNENIEGFDSSAPYGNQILTIKVEGQEATFTVNIIRNPAIPVLQSIEITHPADKLTYFVGEDLDFTGLEVTGMYLDENGDVDLIPVVITNENVGGFDNSVAVNNLELTVTVKDLGDPAILKTATFFVNIVPAPVPTLESIAITNPANKLNYNIGEALNIDGLQVTGTYSDGSEKIETITTTNITGFDSQSAVTGQVLTITVADANNPEIIKTATYTINVIAPAIGGGTYVPPPTQTLNGDINGDNSINEYDLAVLMAQWGQSGTSLSADLNKDSKVDEYDLAMLMAKWSL